MLQRKIEMMLNIELKPDELARCFWAMTSGEQCEFFNTLGALPDSHFDFCMQLQAVTDCNKLNRDGRDAMASIGEYSERY